MPMPRSQAYRSGEDQQIMFAQGLVELSEVTLRNTTVGDGLKIVIILMSQSWSHLQRIWIQQGQNHESIVSILQNHQRTML